jgi:hypothetical protein
MDHAQSIRNRSVDQWGWVKWGAYALASGVSLSRYPAKNRYPSGILIGATLGYVTGTYLAEH